MEKILTLFTVKLSSPFTYLTIALIMMDTVFGCARAVKQHVLNSSFGIDGAIRKIAMLVCLAFCAVIDLIININLLPHLPDNIGKAMGYFNINYLGLAEFFAVLFIMYEVVSVLKNTYLCGLPTKRVYIVVRSILSKYTDELPDTDEEGNYDN